jgi:hypothetical protein
MPPRTIDYYDLTFVISGSMTYVADNEIFVLKKNDAIFLKPGTLRVRYEGNEPVKYVSFNFKAIPNVELEFDKYLPNCISSDIKKIVSAFPQSHLSPYYHSKEKVGCILNYILFELLDVVSLKSNNPYVLKVTRYVGEHITEKMSLQSISGVIGLSKEYTANIFKKEVEKTLELKSVTLNLLIPFSKGALVNNIRNSGKILEEDFTNDGTKLRAILPTIEADKYKDYIL